MKRIEWNIEKEQALIEGRKISFRIVADIIIKEKSITVVKHPNNDKYPNQRIFIVNIQNYIYLVPFVEDEQKIFLKTIIPSRKATRDYLIKKTNKK